MKHLFLTLLLATLCAATSYGQTITSLGYNTTNGQIVAATNVVWTNSFSFSTNTVAAQVRTNLGLGATNIPTFSNVDLEIFGAGGASGFAGRKEDGNFQLRGTNVAVAVPAFFGWDGFVSTALSAGESRTNLGLGLPALTNTSNVTAMRALSGSTNTNEPYSGSVALTNTNVLVFSNGILQSVQ
jgi:hypothetical protein